MGSRQEDRAGPAPGSALLFGPLCEEGRARQAAAGWPQGFAQRPGDRQALVSPGSGRGLGAASAPRAPSQTCGCRGPAAPWSQCSHLQTAGQTHPVCRVEVLSGLLGSNTRPSASFSSSGVLRSWKRALRKTELTPRCRSQTKFPSPFHCLFSASILSTNICWPSPCASTAGRRPRRGCRADVA